MFDLPDPDVVPITRPPARTCLSWRCACLLETPVVHEEKKMVQSTRATSAPHQPPPPARPNVLLRASRRRHAQAGESSPPLPSHPIPSRRSHNPSTTAAAALPHPQRRHPNSSQGNRSHRPSPSSSLALHLRRTSYHPSSLIRVPTCLCCPAMITHPEGEGDSRQ